MSVDIQVDAGIGPSDIVLKLSDNVPKPLHDFVGSLISARYNLKALSFVIHVREFEAVRQMADELLIESRDASDSALQRIADWDFKATYDTALKTNAVFDPKSLNLKTDLYIDQVRGIQFLSTRQRSLLADNMGVGKSIQTLATYSHWRNQGIVFSAIIIGINSVKYGWVKEIAKHTDFSVTMLGNGTEKVLAGIENYRAMPTDFLVLHYEAICDKKERVLNALLEIPFDAIFIDEAHLLKNIATARYKNVARLVSELHCPIQELADVTYESEEGFSVTRLAHTSRVRLGDVVDVF